jgi:hypothetical protein
MSPKIILWISFSVISSTWYALDPDARFALGTSVAASSATQIEHMVQSESLEVRARTAMN